MFALANFLKPEKILDKGGLALLSLIVFAESGLLVGFFLPGDSLLFVAGFLSSDAGDHKLPALPFVVICVRRRGHRRPGRLSLRTQGRAGVVHPPRLALCSNSRTW